MSAAFTVSVAVDIAGGRCTRRLRAPGGRSGTDEPVAVARALAGAGARRLHVVDLDAVRTGAPANRRLLLETIREAGCPVQAGGLIGPGDVEEVLAAGADTALLSSRALADEDALRACGRFRNRLGATLETRDEGGRSRVGGRALGEAARAFERAGARLLVVIGTGRDGTLAGPDLAGLAEVRAATSLPLVASGGISSLDHIATLARMGDAGVAGAVVGRAVYEGSFSPGEANAVADEAAAGPGRQKGVRGGLTRARP
jgi:phosphoribosylformimino-5-aminoimidazole carboxamide ribonucleotide (ProFAR) isomerase